MQSRKMLGVLVVLFVVLQLGTSAEAQLTASGLQNPHFTANAGVLPPQSHAFGNTYGEWSARWWQWVYSLPADMHPLFDAADCSEGQSGKVWFLGGTFSTVPDPEDPSVVVGTAERSCTVPPGKALFFPIINAECNTLDDSGATEADLRSCANFLADHFQNMQVLVDGQQLEHLALYRAESPFFTWGPLPDNNIAGVEPGTEENSVADGYYIMLAPLSAGEHTIHFEGEGVFTLEEDGFDLTFILDIHYLITVGRN